MASITAMLLTLLIGHSVQGRPIEVVHVAGPGPRVLVVGSIHGDEPAGIPVARALARVRHPRADLWVVPSLNPDGVALHTRANAHGVDLNRDFPNGREPETHAAVALIRRIHPRYSIWFHQHQDLVRAWGRSVPAAKRYARLARMRFSSLVWPAGAVTRWQNGLGETSFVVELPAGRLDAAGVRRHVDATLRLPFAAP